MAQDAPDPVSCGGPRGEPRNRITHLRPSGIRWARTRTITLPGASYSEFAPFRDDMLHFSHEVTGYRTVPFVGEDALAALIRA